MGCQHSSRAMRGTRLSALMQHGPWSFMVVHGRFGDGFGKTRPAPGTTEKHRTLGKFGLSNLVPVGTQQV
jgi:hypothetical protein